MGMKTGRVSVRRTNTRTGEIREEMQAVATGTAGPSATARHRGRVLAGVATVFLALACGMPLLAGPSEGEMPFRRPGPEAQMAMPAPPPGATVAVPLATQPVSDEQIATPAVGVGQDQIARPIGDDRHAAQEPAAPRGKLRIENRPVLAPMSSAARPAPVPMPVLPAQAEQRTLSHDALAAAVVNAVTAVLTDTTPPAPKPVQWNRAERVATNPAINPAFAPAAAL